MENKQYNEQVDINTINSENVKCNNYNDFATMTPEVMEKVAKKYYEQIATKQTFESFKYDDIFLLLKENCRIFYAALDYYQKKNNSHAYFIIQKVLIKCENLENLIKPYCATILKERNNINIKKSLPVCVINFANIVNQILFGNYNKKNQEIALFDKNSQNTTKIEQFLHINNKIIHICLQGIIDLQTIFA